MWFKAMSFGVATCLISLCAYADELGRGRDNARSLACAEAIVENPLQFFPGKHLVDLPSKQQEADILRSFDELQHSEVARNLLNYAERLDLSKKEDYSTKECYVLAPLAAIARNVVQLRVETHNATTAFGRSVDHDVKISAGPLLEKDKDGQYILPASLAKVVAKCSMSAYWDNYCKYEFSSDDVVKYLRQYGPIVAK